MHWAIYSGRIRACKRNLLPNTKRGKPTSDSVVELAWFGMSMFSNLLTLELPTVANVCVLPMFLSAIANHRLIDSIGNRSLTDTLDASEEF